MKSKKRILAFVIVVIVTLLITTFTVIVVQAAKANKTLEEAISGSEKMGSFELLRRDVPFLFGSYLATSSKKPCLDRISELYPIEYLRRIDDDTLLTIYKTEDGNNDTIYVYFFFKNHGDNKEEIIYSDWWLFGDVWFSSKTLSKDDFKNIKIGSQAVEVQKIDAVTKQFVGDIREDNLWVDWVQNDEKIYAPTVSRHILSDGILTIEYEINEKGLGFVKNVEYSQYISISDYTSGKKFNVLLNENDLKNER